MLLMLDGKLRAKMVIPMTIAEHYFNYSVLKSKK